MKGINPVMLSRGIVMDLPTIYSSQNGVIVLNGFGRYVKRLEKFLVKNNYDVASAVRVSCQEMGPQTVDGRKW